MNLLWCSWASKSTDTKQLCALGPQLYHLCSGDNGTSFTKVKSSISFLGVLKLCHLCFCGVIYRRHTNLQGKSITICFLLTLQHPPCEWGVTILISEQAGTPRLRGCTSRVDDMSDSDCAPTEWWKFSMVPGPLCLPSFGDTAHLRPISGGPGKKALAALCRCACLRKQNSHGP